MTNCPITVRGMDGASGVLWVRVARRAACVALLMALLVFPLAVTVVAGEPGTSNGARAADRCANAAEAAQERCDKAPSDDEADIERGHRADASSGDRPPDVELPATALEHLPPSAVENLASVAPLQATVAPLSAAASAPPASFAPTDAPALSDDVVGPESSAGQPLPAAAAAAHPAAYESGGSATRPVVVPSVSFTPAAASVETLAKAEGTARGAAMLRGSQPDVHDLPLLPIAVITLTPAIAPIAASAMELGRIVNGFASTIVFNVWLRRQLRERRMSQRQLAAFSGVDHSTISRLLSGARAPSLATATKLADALRKLGGPESAADYFARQSETQVFPTKRVESALLGDDELEDDDVRELMNAYLNVRARRRRERLEAAPSAEEA